MANSFDAALLKAVFAQFQNIGREMTGGIGAVSLDPKGDGVAVGTKITSDYVPAATSSSYTPGVASPAGVDTTVSKIQMEITDQEVSTFHWNGEEQLKLGSQRAADVFAKQVTQAVRVLVNKMEVDICAEGMKAASRAVGTLGTFPFLNARRLNDTAELIEQLNINAAPQADRQLVLSHSAMATLRGDQPSLFNVNEAGDPALMREGAIGRLQGFNLHESPGIKEVTAGTGANATTDTAGYAKGATTINLASAGTGTLIAGDIVTFAGDSNQYVLESGDTDVSDGGSIVLQKPGLREPLAASAVAITKLASSTRNLAFTRDALHLATRTIAIPSDGDQGIHTTLVDPQTNIAFLLSRYPQYGQNMYQVGCAWGVKATQPENNILLLQ